MQLRGKVDLNWKLFISNISRKVVDATSSGDVSSLVLFFLFSVIFSAVCYECRD